VTDSDRQSSTALTTPHDTAESCPQLVKGDWWVDQVGRLLAQQLDEHRRIAIEEVAQELVR